MNELSDEFIEETLKDLDEAITKSMEENLSTKDDEGFQFLTNHNKSNMEMPFDFAREYGFAQPIFKIKEAMIPNNDWFQLTGRFNNEQVLDNRKRLHENSEGIWVKEGLGDEDESNTNN